MKAGRLDVLKGLFGEVYLPEAVFSEVTSNETFRAEADLIRNSDYIKIVKVTNLDRVAFLQRATGLDGTDHRANFSSKPLNRTERRYRSFLKSKR